MDIKKYKECTNAKGFYSEIDFIYEISFDEFDIGKIQPEIIVSPNGTLAAIDDVENKQILLISLPEKILLQKLILTEFKETNSKMLFSLDSQYLILQYSNFILIHNQHLQKPFVKLKLLGQQLEVVHIISDKYDQLYIGRIKPYSQSQPQIQIYDLKQCVLQKQIKINIFGIQEIQETLYFQNVSKHCLVAHVEDSLFFLLNCQTSKYLKIYSCPFVHNYNYWNFLLVYPFACVQSDNQIKILQLFKWKQIRKIMINQFSFHFLAFLTKNDLIIFVDDDTNDEEIKIQEIQCFKFQIFIQNNPFQANSHTEIQSNPQILVRTKDEKFQIIQYK